MNYRRNNPYGPDPRDNGQDGGGYEGAGGVGGGEPVPNPAGVTDERVPASARGGPAGVGGSGGYGFVNLSQYLYANPNQTGGQAPTPAGMSLGQYNPAIHGFSPSGAYTPGMAGVDNAMNAAYGHNAGMSPWAGQVGSGRAPVSGPPHIPPPSGGGEGSGDLDPRGRGARFRNIYGSMGY